MTILETDIFLLKAERMQDTDDGGGLVTGDAVEDAVSNEVFDDISELDRTYGDVSLRKVFPAVLTNTVERYYGAHLTVDVPFADGSVEGLLFKTGDWADERLDAANAIESYVIAGPISPFYVWGVQVENTRSVLLWGRVGVAPPDVGEVYYIVQDEGDPAEVYQYVRIIDVEVETRVFTDNVGDYERDIITCEISAPLRYTFSGPEVTRTTPGTLDCKFRETDVADAAKYYGVKTLATTAAPTDVTIELASIYGQIVPSTRTESPVTDVYVGANVSQDFVSGGETFEIPGPAHTGSVEITIGNRAYVYVYSCVPVPAPGTLTVAYRALGKWYQMSDDGTGVLSGSGGGAGSVSYTTGTVSITLGALPDVDSDIVYTWGGKVHYVDRAGTALVSAPVLQHDLGEAVDPGSASFSWLEATVTKTATAAASGAITGDATGYMSHATGEFWLEFSTLPDSGSQLQVDYDADTKVTEIFSGLSDTGGVVTFTLTSLPVKPGSVRAKWTAQELNEASATSFEMTQVPSESFNAKLLGMVTEASVQLRKFYMSTYDDGSNNLGPGSGAVNYTTGACSLEVLPDIPINAYASTTGGWTDTGSHEVEFNSGVVTVEYVQNTVTPTSKTVYVDLPSPEIQFLPLLADGLVPGTVRFTLGGKAFTDGAGLGFLYWDDATLAGSINYETRIATLDQHIGGTTVTVDSLVSVYGDWTDYEFSFRTPGSPIQPASLTISALSYAGDLITATCDASGVIDTTEAEGTVNQDMGVAYVRFGALVLDSSLTPEEKAEHWYDPADVDGSGYIWKPTFVYPSTVRFSCVVYSYLPLDAEILGLDPVRLPSDGRVPIFRPADVVVIHHEDTETVTTPSIGLEVDCGRERLARVRVYDVDGERLVEDTDYTVNLDTGIVTLGDTSGYTAPLSVVHRVEDMRLVADVQIDGTVRVTQQLTHDFPADETLVSTALIIGDMYARVANLFDQDVWTGEWSDELIGDPAGGTYNDTTYPLTVTNEGAITERWALVFTGSTAYQVIGENVGQIATGNVTTDLAPINPNTGVPYFTMLALGWGSGWSTGEVVRFNTYGANYPVWCCRSVEQGSSAADDDAMTLYIRGDIDAGG